MNNEGGRRNDGRKDGIIIQQEREREGELLEAGMMSDRGGEGILKIGTWLSGWLAGVPATALLVIVYAISPIRSSRW